MNASNRIWSVGRAMYEQAVSALMRGAVSLIAHSGPLQPALHRLGYRLYIQFVPRSLNESLPNPLTVDGLVLYHDGQSDLPRMMATGTFEPHVTRLVSRLVKPGMIVLDVGANMGYYSLLAARLTNEAGAVWAFEPAPAVLELLRQSVAENGYNSRVHIIPLAVSNTCGTARLYVNPDEQLLSSLYADASQQPAAAQDALSVAVECTTLDAWAEAHGWPAVDLVKIDIEGSETAVLEGMAELSRRSPQLKVIVEFNVRTLQAAGATVEQFFSALDACGLKHVSVIGTRPRPLTLPADISWLLHQVGNRGADYVNLLCEKAG